MALYRRRVLTSDYVCIHSIVMGMDLALCAHCDCLAARRNARAITRHFEARPRCHGVRATQFSIFAALALARPMKMGELAELLGIERTMLTRSERSEDGRERNLRLTASGRPTLEAAYPSWKAAQDSVA